MAIFVVGCGKEAIVLNLFEYTKKNRTFKP